MNPKPSCGAQTLIKEKLDTGCTFVCHSTLAQGHTRSVNTKDYNMKPLKATGT